MRTHGAIAATAAAMLGCSAPAQDATGLEAVLARFPDHETPQLLLRLRSPEGRLETLRALREIGRPAHEPLLGFLRGPDPFGGSTFPLPPSMDEAFGDFDARTAWTLPVLIGLLDRYDARDCVLGLLARLGPAAAPAADSLRALAEQEGPHAEAARRLLEDLTGEPLAAESAAVREAPPPAAIPSASKPELLERLAEGPSRFPALQALVASGDEPAAEAAVVLLQLAHDEATRAEAVPLLAWLRYVYRARGALDLGSIHLLAEDERARELRRHALAGASSWNALDVGRTVALGQPELDRLLALRLAIDACAGRRDLLAEVSTRKLAESTDAEVHRLLRLARPASSPARRDEILDTLRAALGSGKEAMQAAMRLGQTELGEVPDDALPLLASALEGGQSIRRFAIDSLATAAIERPERLDRILELAGERHHQGLLQRVVRGPGYSRQLLPRLVELAGSGELRSLTLPGPAVAADDLFALLRDPATRSGALHLLERATYREDWAKASEGLAPELLGWMREMEPAEQNMVVSVLLRLKGEGMSAIARLCREGPVELRRKLASRLAWNPADSREYAELMSELAQDEDLEVAARAVRGMLGLADHADWARERLVELWDAAETERHRDLLAWITGQCGPAAAGLLPRVEAQFAREDPGQRALGMAAALRIRPGHERATELLRGLLRSEDPVVRERAFSAVRTDSQVMDAFVPEIARALDSDHRRVRYQALRALEKLPGRWPEVKEKLQRWSLSNDSVVAQGANRMLEELAKR